jgi:glycerol-3-phosphate cytidylyltransferase-like family protein
MKIKITKKIHPMWEEFQRLKKKSEFKSVYKNSIEGKWQHIYSTKKARISLVELKDYWMDGKDLWEIYQLDGHNLFPDVERFDTKKEAVERIKELLRTKQLNTKNQKGGEENI